MQPIAGQYRSVWEYDASVDKWRRYVVDGLEYLNDLETMENGRGYWLDMINPAALILVGEATDAPIQLYEGWNLVGCNYTTVKSIEEAVAPIVSECESVWMYYAALNEWRRYVVGGLEYLNNLDFIEPKWGYWIEVSADCLWTQ